MKNISSLSITADSNNHIYNEYELSSISNISIEANVKCSNIKGWGIGITNDLSLSQSGDAVWGKMTRIAVGNAGTWILQAYDGNNYSKTNNVSPSSNTEYDLKLTHNNGEIKGYIGTTLIDTINCTLPSNTKYVVVNSWTNAKTITIKDLKIKPL